MTTTNLIPTPLLLLEGTNLLLSIRGLSFTCSCCCGTMNNMRRVTHRLGGGQSLLSAARVPIRRKGTLTPFTSLQRPCLPLAAVSSLPACGIPMRLSLEKCSISACSKVPLHRTVSTASSTSKEKKSRSTAADNTPETFAPSLTTASSDSLSEETSQNAQISATSSTDDSVLPSASSIFTNSSNPKLNLLLHVDMDELRETASKRCTPLSLKDMYKYAVKDVNNPEQRMWNAQFLHKE